MHSRLGWLGRMCWGGFAVVGGLSLLLMLVNIVADVALRWFLGSGVYGTISLVSEYWMVGIVMTGIALAQRDDSQIQVDFLTESLGPKPKRLALTAVFAFVVLASLLVAGFSLQQALDQMALGEMSSIGNRPLWPVRFMIPLSFFAVAIAAATSTVRLWRRTTDDAPGRG